MILVEFEELTDALLGHGVEGHHTTTRAFILKDSLRIAQGSGKMQVLAGLPIFGHEMGDDP